MTVRTGLYGSPGISGLLVAKDVVPSAAKSGLSGAARLQSVCKELGSYLAHSIESSTQAASIPRCVCRMESFRVDQSLQISTIYPIGSSAEDELNAAEHYG
jgi:hypothetical protein